MSAVTPPGDLPALAAWAEAGAARYRTLFTAIDEGFCVIEILRDGAGRPVDYRFLEANPAFARHTGLPDAVGRTAREVVPDLDPVWFAIYGRVATTGVPERFQEPAVAMGREFDVYAFPLGEPGDDQIAILFTDISDRRRRERNLAFLADVADELDRLTAVGDIARSAGARLGAYLEVDRCDVLEVDGTGDVAGSVPAWTAPGTAPALGTPPVAAVLARAAPEGRRAAEAVAVDDVRADPRTRAAAPAFEAAGARSWLAVTVAPEADGSGARALVLSAAAPREWRRDELDLVSELSHRLAARLARAHAREAVQDREWRLRLALEASGAGTFTWYPEADRGDPDDRMRALLGIGPGDEASLRGILGSVVHPASRAGTEAALARALDPGGGGLYRDEVRIVTAAGDDRWLSVAGRVEFAGHPPRPIRMFGMATDVTARRRAEDALRASAARQALLVRLNDVLRPLTRPTAIGEAAARALREHLAADEAAVVRDAADAPEGALVARLGGPDDGAGALVVTDAGRGWRPDEAELVQEVADRAWAAMERAHAAVAVRDSERRLRRVLAIETVGVIFLDRSGTLTDANQAFLRASGYGRADVARRALTLDGITPEDARGTAREALDELRRRGRTEPREREFLRRDGTRWPALVAATMLSGSEAAVFVVDLTAVRAAREAARAEREVREQREREFVANAAHELRTPLTAIIGAVHALQAGAAGIPEERDRFLAHLGREAARLARLSDSLLQLAQTDDARTLPRAPVQLLEVLDDVAADLAVAPGVVLRVDADPAIEVVTNQGLVERVVANFAANAARHTDAGRIELSARRDDGAVVVEVRDTGTGLGEGAERVFDRFYRAGDRGADGFGLGLAIALQAAAALGGTVDLADAPGGGTLARLVLPDA